MSNARVRREEVEHFLGMEARMAYLGGLAAKSQFDEYCKFVDGKTMRLSQKLSTRLAVSVLGVEDVFVLRSMAMSAIDDLVAVANNWLDCGRVPTISMGIERLHDLQRLIVLLEEEGWIRWYLGEITVEPNWAIR